MDSNYCPIYQPGLLPGAKCALLSDWIGEQLPCFGMKLPANGVTYIYQIRLGRNVPIQLWALRKISKMDSTDGSQGVLFGMDITLKLWELCPEVICINCF